ncbi:hypothetical protein GCM10010294_69920 [Streptomyces griseoloalbus]|nr:hypothetical protein GCM10010294_69920 [Streptomyces griseoloalbus]
MTTALGVEQVFLSSSRKNPPAEHGRPLPANQPEDRPTRGAGAGERMSPAAVKARRVTGLSQRTAAANSRGTVREPPCRLGRQRARRGVAHRPQTSSLLPDYVREHRKGGAVRTGCAPGGAVRRTRLRL